MAIVERKRPALAGYRTEKLLAALRKIDLNALEQPVVEIEL
jgi:hypothetical protein